MSFSSDVKSELCRTEPKRCCRRAECYGLLLFGRYFTAANVCVLTGHREAARRAAEFTAEITGAVMDVSASAKAGAGTYMVSAPSAEQAEKVLTSLGHTGREISLHINLANVENDCCRSAFLRGAFLSCGTVTDPRKDYRMEFTVPFMNLAKDLGAFLRDVYELDLQPGIANRKGTFVVYITGGDRVADLLTFMGAAKAAMDLMQIKMLKEVRNNVNRKTNFETANIDKTASAAALQMMAIERLNAERGLSSLPEDLRELALLRSQNPEMSLRELGQSLNPPLSRSGVHHRLQRIVELAGMKAEP